MSFLGRLFGFKQNPQPAQHQPLYGDQPLYGQQPHSYQQPYGQQPTSEDEKALARYRYMLRTAPPEMIEQAHEEAFSKLTPEQRAMVLRELNTTVPAHERVPEIPGHDDPRTLARMATRAEMRQPGTIERTLGGMQRGHGGMGMMGAGGMIAGTIFGALVAGFVGSMVAEAMLEGFEEFGAEETLGGDMLAEEPIGDLGGDFGSDFGGDGFEF